MRLGWKLLIVVYPLIMGAFSISLWFARTKLNSFYGLDWKDFVTLRVICLSTATLFWILALLTLIKRHRSFSLLWGGTLIIGAALLVLPAPAAKMAFEDVLRLCLGLGLGAHLALFVINDRCLPRS